MSDTQPVPTGRYRHYKGNEYSVIGTARHHESLEEWIVYRQDSDEGALWVRPREDFVENVLVDKREVSRFQHLPSGAATATSGLDNLFEVVPSALPSEVIQTLLQGSEVRIERIVSRGHTSPPGFWYNQEQSEWVVVLAGAARVQFEDRVVDMQVGAFINIPAGEKHRVEWTAPDETTIWLAVYYS